VHEAYHDTLTQLANRALFRERISDALAHRTGDDDDVTVLFLDLDGFKEVNDSLGHLAGDQLLVQVAVRLRESVRVGDMVARFGGDEFMLLCDDVASAEDATSMSDRLGAELAMPFELDEDLNVTVRASIGIVLAEDRTRPPELLLQEAERALSTAKRRHGRWELAKTAVARAAVA
jgi:diguanylate cyclase (GGDEF)-like protein